MTHLPSPATPSPSYWWRSLETRPMGVLPASQGPETAVTPICLLPRTPHRTPQPGDLCPGCGQGILAYDGLFILSCDHCGQVAESGCFS